MLTAGDEQLLLELLNTTPVVDGEPTDTLAGGSGPAFARRHGGSGTAAEVARLRDVRDTLQQVVRGTIPTTTRLAALLGDVVLTPTVTDEGISWEPRAAEDERLAVRAVLTWSQVLTELPGRLRACANRECHLFLLDHSRPGAAKWCSMATCGNRMKARAHASRRRGRRDGSRRPADSREHEPPR